MINLTSEERDKFISWLDQEATSGAQLLEQAGKLTGGVGEMVAKKLRTEVLAYRVVASIMVNTETMTIEEASK